MNETNDAPWLAFGTLARAYPEDGGVRMTSDLTRWLLQERQRLQLPVPPVIQQILHIVAPDREGGTADH